MVIIGAGIAGMVLAYELRKAGYPPLVLEARPRPGGRNWSLRGGDTVVETGSTQHVAWDRGEHLYFNPGPARLPYHHEGILSYCRTLGVPLEVLCNDNRGALMQDDHAFDGAPQLNRRVVNDVARLCRGAGGKGGGQGPAGAAGQRGGQGPAPRAAAQLWRAGQGPCLSRLAAPAGRAARRRTHAGTPNQPLDLQRILALGFLARADAISAKAPPWRRRCCSRSAAWAASARPSGGTARRHHLPGGGDAAAPHRGRARASPGATRRTGAAHAHRGTVRCRHHPASRPCASIPCRLRTRRRAPRSRPSITCPAAKIAFQAARRFWELDHSIYGGISWTSRDIDPGLVSLGRHSSAQRHPGRRIYLDGRPRREVRRNAAGSAYRSRVGGWRAAAPRLSPHLTKGVSVAWKNMPYSGGGWATWDPRGACAALSHAAQGRWPVPVCRRAHVLLTGWQEGALLSAHYTLRNIAGRMSG